MTKKHFKLLAEMVSKLRSKNFDCLTLNAVEVELIRICRSMNPNFDTYRFSQACRKESFDGESNDRVAW
jgi:hypothetical protein